MQEVTVVGRLAHNVFAVAAGSARVPGVCSVIGVDSQRSASQLMHALEQRNKAAVAGLSRLLGYQFLQTDGSPGHPFELHVYHEFDSEHSLNAVSRNKSIEEQTLWELANFLFGFLEQAQKLPGLPPVLSLNSVQITPFRILDTVALNSPDFYRSNIRPSQQCLHILLEASVGHPLPSKLSLSKFSAIIEQEVQTKLSAYWVNVLKELAQGRLPVLQVNPSVHRQAEFYLVHRALPSVSKEASNSSALSIPNGMRAYRTTSEKQDSQKIATTTIVSQRYNSGKENRPIQQQQQQQLYQQVKYLPKSERNGYSGRTEGGSMLATTLRPISEQEVEESIFDESD